MPLIKKIWSVSLLLLTAETGKAVSSTQIKFTIIFQTMQVPKNHEETRKTRILLFTLVIISWLKHWNALCLIGWKPRTKTPMVHQFLGSPVSLSKWSNESIECWGHPANLQQSVTHIIFYFCSLLQFLLLLKNAGSMKFCFLSIYQVEYNQTVSVNTRGSTDPSIKLTQSLHLMSSVEWVFHLQFL